MKPKRKHGCQAPESEKNPAAKQPDAKLSEECKSAKPKDEKIRSYWSGVFQIGVFIVVTLLLMHIKGVTDFLSIDFNHPILSIGNIFTAFVSHPLFCIFALGCLISVCYSMATGKSKLEMTNVILWLVVTVVVVMMLIPKHDEQHGQKNQQDKIPMTNYTQFTGYEPGENIFSLDSGGSKVIHFPAGKTTNWAVDTKKERCGNDSLIIIGKGDTLRTWLPNQHWNGRHDSLILLALAPMRDIKLTIW
ncbi:MAG: hypothetical protein PHO56_03865 [Patescibacteria group bacterium]|nr:hypothetical protein [Patescibacteria group bacterium]